MNLQRRTSVLKHACIGLIILSSVLAPSVVQKIVQEVPVVTVGTMPLYPRVALLAHIEGIVKIKVTTDGKKVSSLATESGPPMLAEAAKKDIQTWNFEKHKPTSFIVTFRYHIVGPAQCGIGNGTTVLHVPLEVEVEANGIQTCDPVVTTKPKGQTGA